MSGKISVEELNNLVNQFESYLIQLGYASNTLSSYRKDIYEYFHFLFDKGVDFSVADHKTVRQYLSDLKKKGLTNTTLARRLSSIKRFYRYLIRNEYSDKSRIVLMRSPKKDEKLVDVLSITEVDKILEVDDKNDFTIFRDKLMLLFLYSTGLRVSELSSLEISDISEENEMLKVTGKGGKQREIPILDVLFKDWQRYLIQRKRIIRENSKNHNYIFVNRFGDRISDRSIRNSMKRLIIKSDTNLDFSPHTIRHTFATHLLDNDADLKGIQELLGHESISTTQKYTHVANSKIFEVYKKFHPHS